MVAIDIGIVANFYADHLLVITLIDLTVGLDIMEHIAPQVDVQISRRLLVTLEIDGTRSEVLIQVGPFRVGSKLLGTDRQGCYKSQHDE